MVKDKVSKKAKENKMQNMIIKWYKTRLEESNSGIGHVTTNYKENATGI